MAGNILGSGYQAQTTSALTTELNALADGSLSALGTQISNSSTKYLLADFEVCIASSYTVSSTSFLTLYLVPAIDDANYASWSTGTAFTGSSQYAVGIIQFPPVSSSTNTRGTVQQITIPTGNYKPAIGSNMGSALPATSNVMTVRFYEYSYT